MPVGTNRSTVNDDRNSHLLLAPRPAAEDVGLNITTPAASAAASTWLVEVDETGPTMTGTRSSLISLFKAAALPSVVLLLSTVTKAIAVPPRRPESLSSSRASSIPLRTALPALFNVPERGNTTPMLNMLSPSLESQPARVRIAQQLRSQSRFVMVTSPLMKHCQVGPKTSASCAATRAQIVAFSCSVTGHPSLAACLRSQLNAAVPMASLAFIRMEGS